MRGPTPKRRRTSVSLRPQVLLDSTLHTATDGPRDAGHTAARPDVTALEGLTRTYMLCVHYLKHVTCINCFPFYKFTPLMDFMKKKPCFSTV